MERGGESYFRSLQRSKENIEKLLSFLEASHEEGSISDDSYYEIKGEGLKKLSQVEKRLRDRVVLRKVSEETVPWARPEMEAMVEPIEFMEAVPQAPHPVQERELDSLLKQKADIESLLSFLEESYHSGGVSEASYQEIRANNLRKLGEIKSKLLNKNLLKEEPLSSSPAMQQMPQQQPVFPASSNMPVVFAPATPAPFVSAPATQESVPASTALETTMPLPVAEAPAETPAPAVPEKKGKGFVSMIHDVAAKFGGKIGELKPKQAQGGGEPLGAVPEVGAAPGADATMPAVPEMMPAMPAMEPAAVMAPSPMPASMPSGGSDVESAKLAMDVEKLGVKVDSLAEMRNVIEERIGRIMESIGEIRSMVFARESSLKELEAKLGKFSAMVQDLEPQKYMRELDKRDKQLSEHAMKLEKTEFVSSDLAKNLNELKQSIESLGSLKNVVEVSRDMGEKTAKVSNLANKVERLSDEVGKVFVELNKKLEEFMLYRAKQDAIEESVKEIITMVDGINSRVDSFALKDDILALKQTGEGFQKNLDEVKGLAVLAKAATELPEQIKDLKKQKEGVEALLASTEEEFKAGSLSEQDYRGMREANLKKLGELEGLIKVELKKLEEMHRARSDYAAQVASEKQKLVESAKRSAVLKKAGKETKPKPFASIAKIALEAKFGEMVLLKARAKVVGREKDENLIQLEDKSGMIHGLSKERLKGTLKVKGVVAKDGDTLYLDELRKA
jgi:hypothetical protein